MNVKQEKQWVRPTISPHNMGTMNKFGHGTKKNFKDHIDGVAVEELVAEYGSPLYVMSENKLRENVNRLQRAFETRYPNVIYSWSYKTNYLGAVCNTLHQEGAWAEVVSAFEYEKARSNGVPAEKILFNGPNKGKAILKRVVEEGGRIHIDNLGELYRLETIAADAGKEIDVTIRLNFDTGFTEPWSRFGFNIENGQALDAARRINESSSLNLAGLHSHIGTFILDPRAYESQVRIMCAFVETVENETGCVIESIDIGGGFASRNALQGVYLPPEQVVPEIEQYATAICNALLEATSSRVAQGKPELTLILESGRHVVDDAGSLISTVVGTKRLPDGRRSLVVDAGVNLMFTAFWYNHQVELAQEVNGIEEDTVIYGPLCMNIDVVRQSISLPPLNIGHRIVLSPVGAYNNTQSMQFIEYRPAVVMIHPDKEVSVIREAEDLKAVTALERMPNHLRLVE
jgi:diaminopimelate decarboxylase